MISDKFVFLGTLINLIGSSTYAVSTMRGRTKPNRVSWFVWSLAAFVAFAAELGQHVGLRALMTFSVGFGPFVVFLASFVNKDAYWRVTRFDLLCGLFSLFALVLWGLTGVGNIAIVLSILADVLATIPTVRKALREPWTEHPVAFLGGSLSASITLLTLKRWTFADGGFPLYILFASFTLFALVSFTFGRANTRRPIRATE